MPFKLFVSDYTYRTEAQQIATLHTKPELITAPVFRPGDEQTMFRPTTRKVSDTYYASSVACFAANEERFKEFLGLCRGKNVCLASIEEGWEWRPGQSTSNAVQVWKAARVNGAAKIGAKISGDKRKAESIEMVMAIQDKWALPSSRYTIKCLETLSGRSRNTIVSILGPRTLAQYNYQAKLKRKANAKR